MKKKIALVTGGYSGESVISYKSAIFIERHIDQNKWDCFKIDINPNGWYYMAPGGAPVPVDKNDFSITPDGNKINFDAVLVGLHGTPGEDGKLQGYFDCLHIPYTSCDAATSALTFNKRYTVAVASFAGLHVAKSIHLFKNSPVTTAAILAQLKLPVFVKPNNGGSSIGMSKVNDPDDLQEALLKAKYEGASEEITPAAIDETTATKVRRQHKKLILFLIVMELYASILFLMKHLHNHFYWRSIPYPDKVMPVLCHNR